MSVCIFPSTYNLNPRGDAGDGIIWWFLFIPRNKKVSDPCQSKCRSSCCYLVMSRDNRVFYFWLYSVNHPHLLQWLPSHQPWWVCFNRTLAWLLWKSGWFGEVWMNNRTVVQIKEANSTWVSAHFKWTRGRTHSTTRGVVGKPSLNKRVCRVERYHYSREKRLAVRRSEEEVNSFHSVFSLCSLCLIIIIIFLPLISHLSSSAYFALLVSETFSGLIVKTWNRNRSRD